ncbi:hypothetical protein ANCCAN_10034 [Ancylostoma caninum]|uniref:Uncharacterized protein n=1 Tax=Ancylostoma caninum TaxID=29170 RepID=A0A368GM96_ANCCA|nr:hypothetical protein ANCCAN_10034 [Ancylostoma caninum]
MISYWKGSQINPTTFSRRNFRGGSFMATYGLKTTIIDAWEDEESDFLENLMNSMLNGPLKWFSTLEGR